MPVRSTGPINPIGLADFYDSSEMPPVSNNCLVDWSIVPSNIWDKFGLDEVSDVEMNNEQEYEDCGPYRPGYPLLKVDHTLCEILLKDCMWNGKSRSIESPVFDPTRYMPPAPGPSEAPVTVKQEYKPASYQQSLLKPSVRAPAVTPQTPPMSDDEEARSKPTQIFQLLKEHILSCDLEYDSDLYDYFEDDDAITDSETVIKEESEDVKPNIKSCQFAAENDHSYYKDKNASKEIDNLGIVTPSDTEEEIDVVSVGDKQTIINKNVYFPPNSPSSRTMQNTMITAIGSNKTSSGIKKMLPTRKNKESATPVKKRSIDKRYKPYTSRKRRTQYGHSSDSEPEPSEKRSIHNNMERQRRIDLRNAFEQLRVLVPEVCKKERAAKVVILKEAAQYCNHLKTVSYNNAKYYQDLKKHQKRIRARLAKLRRGFAATHFGIQFEDFEFSDFDDLEC